MSNSLYGQVLADFSVDNQDGCNTVQSQFSDLSSSSDGAIVEWLWSIGDVTSTLQNPGRVFSDVGFFDICLTVKDENGNEHSLCKQDYIKVFAKPVADFSFDITAGCSPLIVNFTDLSSSPNGDLVEWEWGLGGTISTLITSDISEPIFTIYEEDGFQTVSLNVTDNKGCFNSVTMQNIIQVEEQPEIIIGTSDPIGCSFPLQVDFENFGNEANIVYEWDFGNGETFTGFDPGPITYNSQGNYDVRVNSKFVGSDCTSEIILDDYISSGGSIQFDFSPKLGCKGLEVQFIDESTIDADSWEWDFGDGETSNERDPIHKYSSAGTYNISLFRDTGECSGVRTSSQKIVVLDNPFIDAVVNNYAGCRLPANVTFSTSEEENVDYSWFISEQGNSITQVSGHSGTYTFTEYGDYLLKIVASNAAGCVTSSTLDTIKIQPLKAEIIGDYQGCIPFDASLGIMTNSPSPIESISWDVEGPWVYSSSGNTLEFTVDQTGKYTASAIVENELGCIDTVVANDLVSGGESPFVDFLVDNTNVCPRELIRFENLSSGDIDSWTWEIGDSLIFETENLETEINKPGIYDVILTVFSNGCQVSKTIENYLTINPPGVHFELEYDCNNPNSITAIDGSTFSDMNIWKYVIDTDTIEISNIDTLEISLPGNGNYHISLEAFNNASGCSNITFDDIEITQPQANFTIDKNSGCAPLQINFNDNSTLAAEWEYFTSSGIFFNSTSPNAQLNLKFGGTYDDGIGLVVKDIHGCSDTMFSETILVNNLVAKFEPPQPICFSDTLFIENTSVANFADIISFNWTIGDGIANSVEEDARFLAPDIGKYDLKLVVEDSWGCLDSSTLGLGAYFRAPNFELIADSLACTTAGVRFRNNLHSAGYKYLWDFGDGTTSEEINPIHLYETEGEYPVMVTIEDNSECISSMDGTELISVYNPLAAFTVDSVFSACPPLIPNFNNNSVNAIEFVWDFGDGTGKENSVSPAHLYTAAGFFDVSLVAIRSDVCRDTILFTDLVELNGPRGEISFEVDSSCVPLHVNFEAQLDEEYTMTWDFGDGNLEVLPDDTNFSSIDHTYENAGNFTPKIILTNEENCTIIREGNNIQTEDLSAEFSVSDSIFCDGIPSTITLTNNSESTSEILSSQWIIDGSEEFNLQGLSAIFMPLDTGISTITLIVNNTFCTDTIRKENLIKIGEATVIELQSDTFFCLGDEINLDEFHDLRDDSYSWSNSTEMLQDSAVIANESQYYFLEVVNDFQCSTLDSLFIEVINDQSRFVGSDRTICKGAETEIDIDFSDLVYWPTVLNCFNCTSITLSPDSTESFPVIATNSFGCLVKDTILIEVLSDDDIDAGEDQRICFSETAVLLAYVPGDIEWTPSIYLSHPNDQLTAVNIPTSTTFTLTSKKGECTLIDSVRIDLIDKAELVVMGDTICAGETAQIFAGGNVDEVRWFQDEGLSDLDVQNPTSNPTEDRAYRVIGELSGCNSDTAMVAVKVYQGISVRVPKEMWYFKGAETVEIELDFASSDDVEISWLPSELVNCQDCESVNVSVDGNPLDIKVIITNQVTGCVTEEIVQVRQYDDCQEASKSIGVPNIFSPNEDGFNDKLSVEAPALGEIKSIDIYDRWGQKVFSGKGLSESWDGKFNGTNVLQGVYTYDISAICPVDGSLIKKTGDITVMR